MSELLKAVEAAARKLASTMAARDVVQRSLDGIIAEQERRATGRASLVVVDHIYPISQGGDRTAGENLQPLCHECLNSKRAGESL